MMLTQEFSLPSKSGLSGAKEIKAENREPGCAHDDAKKFWTGLLMTKVSEKVAEQPAYP